jgi:DNA polymerase III alpha subunit (gram-positive type)
VDSDDMEYTEDAIDNMIPVSSNIYRPTINSTGPNLKTTLMTINSNHQNSKHDDVPNIISNRIDKIRE